MAKPRAAVSWSGGKDSCLALHRTHQKFEVTALITMFTEDGTRSRSHGLRPEVLQRQADLLGLELVCGCASWKSYEEEFLRVLRELHARGFSHVVFGDIFLDPHKEWVERVCGKTGLQAIEPLWENDTCGLFQEFLNAGGQAVIVCVEASKLGDHWLKRQLCPEMLPQLQQLGIDPCGEYGEYHTLVTHFPCFRTALHVREVGKFLHDGYWMVDLTTEST